ncbi:hypothetical protein BZL30_8801 [Mycobacterium kansasii]|uniref:Uncharacterized protein n=1 Tax=Mycobacterium kansasii TaxID=1768 RepID=A0A1V3WGT4_MYCKA|nr:hypothetical protein BZL30_8801 [Mycobacterium kansasii]OOK67096.1 hypothetical protein BZL29_7339 [Mycobacterium kansasii]
MRRAHRSSAPSTATDVVVVITAQSMLILPISTLCGIGVTN